MRSHEQASQDAHDREVSELRARIAELEAALQQQESSSATSISEREAFLREAERAIHLGTWTWDIPSEAFTWSDELYRILGLDPAQTPTRAAFDARVHPDERERVGAAIDKLLQDGRFPVIECRVVRPDGTIRRVALSASCLRDGHGNPRRLIGAVLDRTASLDAEFELRRTLALLEEAQSFAQLGSWRFDPQTGETEWSREFRRIAGLASDVAPSVPAFLGCILPEDQAAFIAQYEHVLKLPGGGEADGRLRRPDGEVRHIRVSGALVPGPTGSPELRGTLLDVTDQVRLREELAHSQKTEAIGRLAAGIAHDFNNLLMVVIGNLDLLEGGVGDSPELEDCKRAVESASNLTRRLLAFGRRAQLSLSVIAPNELVGSTMSLMRRLVTDQVRLETQLAPELPAIRIDPVELERALVNLVVNARDVMPKGGLVTISTSRCEVDGAEWVDITVKDEGPGIPQTELPQIFEPFYTTRHASGGSGLGLATVLGTAEQHGGTVKVSTQVGRGSAFTIRLPGVSAGVVASVPRAPVDVVTMNLQGLKILIVDDEPMVAEAARRMLSARTHVVYVATSPDEAVAVWSQHKSELDLVLCDVVMPEMRGPELVRRLSENNTSPRVLFMSGYNDEATFAELEHPVLAKPFNLLALEQAIERVVSGT
jgi:two-component system, cell cycle sensor histidine kinase and response regulator CckA